MRARSSFYPLRASAGSTRPGVAPYFHIDETPDGRFLVTSPTARGEIGIYTAAGTLLDVYARTGAGPGEFLTTRHIFAAGDSIVILDPGNRRASVFTSNMEFARLHPVPAQVYSGLILPDGRRLFSMMIPGPGTSGQPIHLLSPTGERLLSFGSDDTLYTMDPFRDTRILGRAAADSLVWAAESDQYRLTRWTVNGRPDAVLEREVDWFSDATDPIVFGPDQPPRSMLRAIDEHPPGMLWVISAVADEHWSRGLTRNAQGGWSITSLENVFDSMVEVIDVASNQILASRRFDAYFEYWIAPDRVAAYRTEGDVPFIDVWRLVLRR